MRADEAVFPEKVKTTVYVVCAVRYPEHVELGRTMQICDGADGSIHSPQPEKSG